MLAPYCCCVALLIAGAAARSSGHFQLPPGGTAQETSRPETERTGYGDESGAFVPVLNSGMNIHAGEEYRQPSLGSRFGDVEQNNGDVTTLSSELNVPAQMRARDATTTEQGTAREEDNADQDKTEVPTPSSGVQVDEHEHKRDVDNIKDDTPKANEENDDEKWLLSITPEDGNQNEGDNRETASDDEIEDEINVQVNVDTAAEVSTEIRRPQNTSKGNKQRGGKLIIKINVKTKKDEPKAFDVPKDLFDKDYDQITCDWLNAMNLNQPTSDATSKHIDLGWPQWLPGLPAPSIPSVSSRPVRSQSSIPRTLTNPTQSSIPFPIIFRYTRSRPF